MSARWKSAWGMLPKKSPVAGSICSASSPAWFPQGDGFIHESPRFGQSAGSDEGVDQPERAGDEGPFFFVHTGLDLTVDALAPSGELVPGQTACGARVERVDNPNRAGFGLVNGRQDVGPVDVALVRP